MLEIQPKMPDSQSPTITSPAPKAPTPNASLATDLRVTSPQASNTPPLASSQVPTSFPTFDSDKSDTQHLSPSPTAKLQSSDTSAFNCAADKSLPANPQQFCLRWNNYQSNLTNVFDQLLQNESFVDVTLACDGNSIKAHKMVLSACSPYFQSLFFDNPCQHPIVIMRDVKWPELMAVVEFMYKGEINVRQEQIAPLLRVAEMLKIRGLADVKSDLDLSSDSEKSTTAEISSASTSERTERAERTKPRISARTEWQINNLNLAQQQSQQLPPQQQPSTSSRCHSRKRRCPSDESKRNVNSPVSVMQSLDANDVSTSTAQQHSVNTPTPIPPFLMPSSGAIDAMALSSLGLPQTEDMEIKPGIAEMIREEERVSRLDFII